MKPEVALRLAGKWEHLGIMPLSDPILVKEAVIALRRHVAALTEGLVAEQNKVELFRRQREAAERQAHEANQLVRQVFTMDWNCNGCSNTLTLEDLGA